MTLHIYTHPSFLEHDTGPGHPEQVGRLRTILDLLDEEPFNAVPVKPAQEATMAQLYRAHPPEYVMKLSDAMPDSGHAYADADTVLSPGTWDAALHAAGAVCQAVDDVLSGACTRAFCAVRPPGHHAGRKKSEGFCLFNNIFIGALQARDVHNVPRIAILDFDVHHGNGTDEMTRHHDGILFASTHQWPLYPGTGVPEDDVPGRIINVPLADGNGSIDFKAAWLYRILPQIHAYAPDLIMISAGFDAHAEDPLAGIQLQDDDFRWITTEIRLLADLVCDGRLVSVLEGGYNLDALKRSVGAHLAALI